MLSLKEANKIFRYNKRTGIISWREDRRGGFIPAGSPAGSINRRTDTSYLAVSVGGKKYYIHRVAWLLAHGVIEDDMQIDHIDGNGLNNRLSNLRLVTIETNQRNRRRARHSHRGPNGVWPIRKSFAAYLGHRYLGCSKSFFEACCLRKSAEAACGFINRD